jgi:hypothetical protein
MTTDHDARNLTHLYFILLLIASCGHASHFLGWNADCGIMEPSVRDSQRAKLAEIGMFGKSVKQVEGVIVWALYAKVYVYISSEV